MAWSLPEDTLGYPLRISRPLLYSLHNTYTRRLVPSPLKNLPTSSVVPIHIQEGLIFFFFFLPNTHNCARVCASVEAHSFLKFVVVAAASSRIQTFIMFSNSRPRDVFILRGEFLLCGLPGAFLTFYIENFFFFSFFFFIWWIKVGSRDGWETRRKGCRVALKDHCIHDFFFSNFASGINSMRLIYRFLNNDQCARSLTHYTLCLGKYLVTRIEKLPLVILSLNSIDNPSFSQASIWNR